MSYSSDFSPRSAAPAARPAISVLSRPEQAALERIVKTATQRPEENFFATALNPGEINAVETLFRRLETMGVIESIPRNDSRVHHVENRPEEDAGDKVGSRWNFELRLTKREINALTRQMERLRGGEASGIALR